MKKLAIKLTLVLLSTGAAGHHANVEHNPNVVAELEGQVTTVSWRNPHIQMSLSVTEEDGSEITWHLEAQDVNSLGRRGMTAELVPEGTTVRVAGNPSYTGHSLYVTNLLLPDGTEIKTRGSVQPRWSSEHIGFDNDPMLADAPVPEADGSRGIYQVWLRAGRGGFGPDLPLTPAAAAWTPDEDPNAQCIAGGMPAVMTRLSGPHPFDFVESDDNILIRLESFDVVRTVHMNAAAEASSQPFSPYGYSTGRWEDDTLIVETSRIDWPYFDTTGRLPQSNQIEMAERFTADDDGSTLSYDLEVTDPETLTETVSAHWDFVARPDLIVEPYECTLEVSAGLR